MNGNPFYVEPADHSQALAGLGAIAGQYRQQKRSEEIKSALTDAYKSGDPNKMAELAIKYPEAQQTLQSLYGFKNDQTKQNALETYKTVLSNKGNPQAALDAINSRIAFVEAQGGDPSTVSVKARDNLQQLIESGQDPSSFFKAAEMDYAGIASPQEWNAYSSAYGGARDVQQAQYVEGLGYVQQLRNGTVTMAELSPDQQQKVKLALDAQAARQAEAYGLKTRTGLETKIELEPELGGAKATAEETAKGSVARRDAWKTQAVAAAENIPTLKRAIELQDAINTGGGINAMRRMANYLGVASQDEGELNSLFGQNILGQLKSTFGGNPTEGEREALAQAQASFNQTGKINSKLLKNALKLAQAKIERGRRAARADKDDATIEEIDAAINVDLGADDGGSGLGAMTPGITPQQQTETAAQRLARLRGGN